MRRLRFLVRPLRIRPSQIGLRLLAFNLLVVFLPVAGILYLDVYETRLLDAQERAMVAQARLLAAALGGTGTISETAAQDLLGRFGRRSDTRLRVYDRNGALIADSIRAPQGNGEPPPRGRYESPAASARHRALYRIGAWLAAARRTIIEWLGPLSSDVSRSADRPIDAASVAPEIGAALQGRYGAATRPTPGQRSLTLTTAVPIHDGAHVIGAVLASQSTFRILQALYGVRLRIFEIVVASMAAAALLSFVMSATVVRPIVRLRRDAAALIDGRGLFRGFRETRRRDEVGDLARALDELTRRLDAHIRLLESFAADVSHEFKNPLASIRTAAEMLSQPGAPDDRARFLQMLTRDVDRLDRLVSGVRELARIDAQLAHEPLTTVDVPELLNEIVEGLKLAGNGDIELVSRQGSQRLRVRASRDRLAQVFENIIENARGFAPDGSAVEIAVEGDHGTCRISIADRGPGIPDAHLDRVFDRFFSYRPNEPPGRREHSGLGLAIAKAIVHGYGGDIAIRNRAEGGALVEVCLPRSQ